MTNAVYSILSRRQAGIITNGIVADTAIGNQHPQNALQAITDRLRAEDSA